MYLAVDVREECDGEGMFLVVVWRLPLAEDAPVWSHEVVLPVLVYDLACSNVCAFLLRHSLLVVHLLALDVHVAYIVQILFFAAEILVHLAGCQRVEALVSRFHLLAPHLYDTAQAYVGWLVEGKVFVFVHVVDGLRGVR